MNNRVGGYRNPLEFHDARYLGFFATESALTTAHPTSEDGKYATVGATDTIWIWDSDTSAWVDSGRSLGRVSTETSSATPTINTDNVDAHSITALATNITSMTTNLSGTPLNFQKLTIRFLDDGTGRSITWGASFQAMGVDLPTTTTASKVLTVGFIYDSVDSKWGCVAVADES